MLWLVHWGNLEGEPISEEQLPKQVLVQADKPLDKPDASTVEVIIDRGIAPKDELRGPKGPVGNVGKKVILGKIVQTKRQVVQSSQ